MIEILIENAGTIVVAAVLIAAVAGILINMKKKKGKG